MSGKQFFINAGLVVEPVQPAAADQVHEVAIAFIVLGQKYEVMADAGKIR